MSFDWFKKHVIYTLFNLSRYSWTGGLNLFTRLYKTLKKGDYNVEWVYYFEEKTNNKKRKIDLWIIRDKKLPLRIKSL